MGKILNVEEGNHKIEIYSLKPFDEVSNESENIISHKEELKENSNEVNTNNENISNFNNELIENLLKKIDELSNQVVNLQNKPENNVQDFDKQLNEVKELAYKNGFNDGYNKAKTENEAEIKTRINKLIESIAKIEEVYKEYQSKAENIEKELVGVAIDIAEQVISKEVSKYSKEIALNLTKELLDDIKEATKIEIKINPIDYEYVKENLNLEKIKITPDNAITPGGVVILSDAGNIEAEISERFKTIKNSILKG